MDEEPTSKSKRILGRDEPGAFDHNVETLGSFKSYGGGLNKLAGPLTMAKWLGFAIASADPSSVDAWGLREAGRAWFNTTDELFKFWDGTQILLLAPLQSVTSMLCFADTFSDASIHWAWEEFKGASDLTQKTIQEASGKMLLSVNANYKAYWDHNYVEAPKVFIGLSTYPCEVITRLDETTSPINDETLAGLFISKAPLAYGANLHYSIGRVRKDSATLNGLAVMKDSFNILASNAITTLPVWLRIRACADSQGASHFYFDYSLDGTTWVTVWELTGDSANSFSLAPACVGPYVVNGINSTDGGTKNGIYGKFDSFTVSMARGPG